MPIPIQKLDQRESKDNYNFDFSFLAAPPTPKIVTASDKDAELLMKIWTQSKKLKDYTYKISSELSSRDFMRLKTGGLVVGDMQKCEITGRGKKMITVMTLGEGNAFLKTKKKKSYTEILASNSKKDKGGYRMPKTAMSEKQETILDKSLNEILSRKTVLACTVKNKSGSIRITKADWEEMGRQAGWVG